MCPAAYLAREEYILTTEAEAAAEAAGAANTTDSASVTATGAALRRRLLEEGKGKTHNGGSTVIAMAEYVVEDFIAVSSDFDEFANLTTWQDGNACAPPHPYTCNPCIAAHHVATSL